MARSHQSIEAIAYELEFGSETRKAFLRSIVRSAKEFFDNPVNKNLFKVMKDKASDQERRARQNQWSEYEAVNTGERLAQELARCCKKEVTTMFEMVYGERFSRGEVIIHPLTKALTVQGGSQTVQKGPNGRVRPN
jgi:hypothetical protein